MIVGINFEGSRVEFNCGWVITTGTGMVGLLDNPKENLSTGVYFRSGCGGSCRGGHC